MKPTGIPSDVAVDGRTPRSRPALDGGDPAARAAQERDRLAGALQGAVRSRQRLAEALTRTETDLRQARRDAEATREARRAEVTTLCSSLEAAEQARAMLVGDHQEQIRAIRVAFEEREATRTARVLWLEAENARLRGALQETADLRARVRTLERELETLSAMGAAPQPDRG